MATRLAEEDDVDARLVRKRRIALLRAADWPHQPHQLDAHRPATRLCNVRHVEDARRVLPRAETTLLHDEAAFVALRGRAQYQGMHRRAARCQQAVLPCRRGQRRAHGVGRRRHVNFFAVKVFSAVCRAQPKQSQSFWRRETPATGVNHTWAAIHTFSIVAQQWRECRRRRVAAAACVLTAQQSSPQLPAGRLDERTMVTRAMLAARAPGTLAKACANC